MVIPSSIHEVIIIPEKFVKEMYTMGEMDDMVEEINRTELAEHEVLCDHAYCFKRNEMELVY